MHRGEQRAAADARQHRLPLESSRPVRSPLTRQQELVEILDEALAIMSTGSDYYEPLDLSHFTQPQ